MNQRISSLRLLSYGTVALTACFAVAEARIESFSPTGFKKDVRQVAVRFSEPMVTLGDPDRPDPFTVRCATPGTGRWIDERHWVYDFEYEVPGAERCAFTLRRGVGTLAGEPIAGPREREFHTGGPTVLISLPSEGREIDERQVFLLALDAKTAETSIKTYVHCRVAGESDTIGVDMVVGSQRTVILDALHASHPRRVDELVKWAARYLSNQDGATLRERALQRIVMVRCRTPLPNGAPMELVWGAGVTGINGLASPRDQVLGFTVRPAFRANVACSATWQEQCLGSIAVRFTAPVERETAEGVRLLDAEGVELPGGISGRRQFREIHFDADVLEEISYRIELDGPIADIDGRPLVNAGEFPLDIRTGRLLPGAALGHRLIVPPGTAAPVLLRRPPNLLTGRRLRVADEPEIARWIARTQDHHHEPRGPWGGRMSSLLAEAEDTTAPFELRLEEYVAPFGVAGVPLVGPGLQVLELTLPPSEGLPDERYVVGTASATRLAVHFEHGRESSLVWVTGLEDAEPVADATVRITDGCTGQSLAEGRTDLDGLARFPTALPHIVCSRPFYLVTARKDGDLAVLPSRVPRWNYEGRQPLKVHTILDRSLFQPGQTVSMKHMLRLATSAGFELPDVSNKEVISSIWHYGSGRVHEGTIAVDANGTATSTFDLPDDAKLGRYEVHVRVDRFGGRSARFRVERFRVGTLRAGISVPTEPIVTPASVPVQVHVEHLAGGGAAHLPVTVRATVEERYNDDWSDPEPPPPITRTVRATLDETGRAQVLIPDIPRLADGGVLSVEMDYRDDNGQTRTTSTSFVELWPAAVRLQIDDGDDDELLPREARIRAYDPTGAPAPGIAVQAEFVLPTWITLDRRLPGGFRASETQTRWHSEGTCSGLTDADGAFACAIPAHLTNDALVRATARDEDGNITRASRWAGRRKETRFLEVTGDRPVSPGDAVRIQTSLPDAEFTALVTVQREGILDAFVRRLTGPDAVVEVPVRANYAPNVRVSVAAIAAAAETPPLDAGLETSASAARLHLQGAPERRHGSVRIAVTSAANALAVTVEPERETYRVRERARVRVRVADPPGLIRRDAEMAIVAVDEGLLEMWPNASWNLPEAMMARRSVDVTSTSSLDEMTGSLSLGSADQAMVGFRPFASGGVAYSMASEPTDRPNAETFRRQRFEPVLLWRGRVSMDDNGSVEVDIPLNDLVTSIRIVAVANAGASLFGTGAATIRTTQDLVLHSGLPPTVREGDRFNASFSVRNATDAERKVSVTARADGLSTLRRRILSLPAGASKEASWRITVPAGVDRLDWDVTAESENATDRLAAHQSVLPSVPVRVEQATLVQLDPHLELPVAPPANALPGRGGVSVALRRSIAGGLDTMRDFMARYRYTCFEQRASVAVALGDPARWSVLMADLENSMDDDGLVKYFPQHRLAWRRDGFPAPVEIPWSAATRLTLNHDGAGAPWGLVEFRAAVPRRNPVERGYRIARTVQAIDRQGSRTWRRGDVARVVLDIDGDRDMTWVVVEDPLPPGAVVLGSGLGGDSALLGGTHEYGDRGPVFTERGFDSYRAYYRFVPKGRMTLRYNVRYNTAGTFRLPPTRVEAMYAPEMHAELPIKPITIGP